MSNVTVNQCDGCGKRVENSYQEPGWIRFEGSFSRSVGKWMKSSYGTAYIERASNGASHFCSLQCLEKKLDALNPVHVEPRLCVTCGRAEPSSGDKT